ncbi:hypothetical protein A2303_07435 [Candidatus Falkowbacteria bacterium RIFOXYB2_FULL_47_14]|nr:MAG: hypothetical protein A2468_07140 [Candidatus Falkowbacteria bacterium RIFOXYC2_FULL_46_15]OGF43693.1 MAG: hypothetical protein A2303_07435 [Candidatus Falkowbacteria bacterium RIFOXYB2_FULL_47_14]
MSIIVIFLAVILGTTAIASGSLAPWVPTRRKDLRRIYRLASIRSGEIFYDLGAGDGRVAFYIARHSGGRVVGIELSLLFYLLCFVKRALSGVKNLSFRFRDIYGEDLTDADAVFVFPASRRALRGKLSEKLKQELKLGARVITYVFPIEGWTPDVVDKPDGQDVAIYLYKKWG